MEKEIIILKHSTRTSKPKFRTLNENESIIIINSKNSCSNALNKPKFKMIDKANKRNLETRQIIINHKQ
jgi:hypothetical protein